MHGPDQNRRVEEFEAEAMPFSGELYRTALRLLQEPGRACDVVQETYLLAWKSFDRYERGTNCKAWLYQILFNVVRHERRRWFKWITGREEDASEAVLIAPTPIPNALEDQEILSALDRLPRQFRDVILLVDVNEFSYKEASEMLRTPIGTVMSRLSRGRGLLREELANVARSYGIGAQREQTMAH
jgi:RNA polymerase sigma-70 factor (ECF subfamily)